MKTFPITAALRGLTHRLVLLALLSVTLLTTACDKDDTTTPPGGGNGSGAQMLVITTGPQSLKPGENVSYKAQFVFADGWVEPAQGVSWSIEGGGTDVAEINASSGNLTVKGAGVAYVKASYDQGGGKVLTAIAPVRVVLTQLFTVAPWAIACDPGFELQFETVVFGTAGRPTVSYQSSNTGVCTVDASGNFRATGTGTATITVTARTADGDQVQEVPVVVVGPPSVPLPVVSVRVSPASDAIFRNDQLQLTAKAFNSNGTEVSETFTWASLNPDVATVDASGKITGVGIGEVTIQAQTKGVIGQAVIEVQPDTVVIVTPFSTSVVAGGSKAFTATVWNARTNSEITSHAPIQWFIPSYPGLDFLNIGTITGSGSLNKTGSLNVKSDALPGNASFVLASVGGSETAAGGAAVQVAVGTGGDCGQGNPDVATIQITNGTSVNLSVTMGSQHQIEFRALDANGTEVADPAVVFNSDNLQVATVDFDGLISAAGEGTATITVCSGGFASATVTVNVTLFKTAQH